MKKRLPLIISLSVLVVVFASSAVCWTVYQARQDGMHITYRPPQFRSHEELLQARAEAMAGGYDLNKLKDVEFYYLPSYAETCCTLNYFTASGLGVAAASFYDLKGYEGPTFGPDFTLIAKRDPDQEFTAEYWLAYTIADRNCKPWVVEGVYYYDVNNSSVGEGLTNFRSFYWIYDGHLFNMYLSARLVEYIEQNDPEAFQGRIFEVVKIYL